MPISNPATISTILAADVQSDMPLMLPGGRLTLVRTDSTAGGTNTTQAFYVPHLHPFIPVLSGRSGLWNYYKIPSDGVLVLNTPNAGAHVDIYATGNLEIGFSILTQFWTTTTARFKPVVLNGLQCVDFGEGVSSRYGTYLGTLRTSGTGSAGRLNDNPQFRHVWNAYNQVEKPVFMFENAVTWEYSTQVYRPLNNNANNRVEMLAGLAGQKVDIEGRFSAIVSSGRNVVFGQSFNNVFDSSTQVVLSAGGQGETSVTNRLLNRAIVGLNTVSALEVVGGGQNVTIAGLGRNGLRGFWAC